MSILATIFVELFNSQCSVCLNNVFCCFCSIVKMQKQKSVLFFNLSNSKKISHLLAQSNTAL